MVFSATLVMPAHSGFSFRLFWYARKVLRRRILQKLYFNNAFQIKILRISECIHSAKCALKFGFNFELIKFLIPRKGKLFLLLSVLYSIKNLLIILIYLFKSAPIIILYSTYKNKVPISCMNELNIFL